MPGATCRNSPHAASDASARQVRHPRRLQLRLARLRPRQPPEPIQRHQHDLRRIRRSPATGSAQACAQCTDLPNLRRHALTNAPEIRSRGMPNAPKPRPQRLIDRALMLGFADAEPVCRFRTGRRVASAVRKAGWRGGGAGQGPETRPPPRQTGNAVPKFHAVTPSPRASWSKTLPGSPAPPPRGPLLPTESYASLTGFSSVPSPAISMRTTSPGLRYTGGFIPRPTPGGVPVAMRSPGISVMRFER